jgi:hypothetical protein
MQYSKRHSNHCTANILARCDGEAKLIGQLILTSRRAVRRVTEFWYTFPDTLP